ncbi:MAG: hypothetical protein K6G11_00935 [Lachnospiraceae bacterium]|nr:hypothetical protein [Lachnospiraceae bacterium]
MTAKTRFRLITLTGLIMFLGMLPFSFTKSTQVDFAKVFGIGELNINYSEIATFGAVSTTTGLTNKQLTEEITELVENYYNAKQAVDINELEKYVSDIDNVAQDKLLTEAEYVEGYENFDCMVLNVFRGSYRVYARYDVKIYNIDTLVPSLSALYVNEDKDGKLQVYLGALTADEQEVIDTLDGLDIVEEISTEVQNELHAVVQGDPQVAQFYQMLRDKTSAESEEEDNTNIENEAVLETPAAQKDKSDKDKKKNKKNNN